MNVSGQNEPTVVFISGNGNDSSVWIDIESDVKTFGVRTVVYDRSGLGKSPLKNRPYHIKDEANDLTHALSKNEVDGAIILVAHSYGGLIAVLVAEGNPNIKGMVLIDALLPLDLNDLVVSGVLSQYTPQFEALEKVAPMLAKAVIPVVKAYPDTAEHVRDVKVRLDLPVIDIVAEYPWVTEPEQVKHVEGVHSEFVARSPMRSSVIAKESSHNVLVDDPKIILESISQMLGRLKIISNNS